MPEIVLAIAGLLVGFFGGLYYAGHQVGRQLRAEIKAGRLTPDDARRIYLMRDVR